MKGWIGCAAALLCIASLAGCSGSSQTVPAEFHMDEELVVYCPHPLEF
ncbi:MAG TPA: ABC transporter substrate-binding protein, partial [Lachnoclostridium sp.]|nr:ABC transporter substrate-binding protein [Lachnoclostridium sp.]